MKAAFVSTAASLATTASLATLLAIAGAQAHVTLPDRAPPAPAFTLAADTEARQGDLSFAGVWARASAGPARNGAGYLTVTNGGAEDDRLVAAAAPTVAARVELHTHIKDGAIMRMRPVDAIDVPAGGSATLAPGGLHLMMFGLKAPLEAGQTFPVILSFERAGDVTVPMEVGKAAPAGHGGHGGHGTSSN